MAKTKLDVGAVVDFLTKGELHDEFEHYYKERQIAEQVKVQGIKYMRTSRLIGTVYNGTIGGFANSATSSAPIGIGGPPWGPEGGYSWSIKRISVSGLFGAGGTGTLPDYVGIYRNNPSGHPIWVLNASTPAVHFGKLDLVLYGGDTLYLGNLPNQANGNTAGTITATGNLIMNCEVIEVPTERLAELA